MTHRNEYESLKRRDALRLVCPQRHGDLKRECLSRWQLEQQHACRYVVLESEQHVLECEVEHRGRSFLTIVAELLPIQNFSQDRNGHKMPFIFPTPWSKLTRWIASVSKQMPNADERLRSQFAEASV